MIERHPPTHRVLRGNRYRQRTWSSRASILLAALLFLAAAPLSAAGPAAGRASGSPPARIAFSIMSTGNQEGSQIVIVRADGEGGVRQLIPGMHNESFCQSADGRKIAYFSDREAPHEEFVYVANADGSDAEKITEKQAGFECPFSERWLLLTRQLVGRMAIVRHDLQTGAEKTVVTETDRFFLSPDGSKLLFVGGLHFGGRAPFVRGKETLELLDLASLERRRIAGPLARTRSFYMPTCGCQGGWSPDGRRFAYAVGPTNHPGRSTVPTPRPYAVYVQSVAGGAARRVLRYSGGEPSESWSADGTKLLVCAQDRGARFSVADEPGCTGGTPGRNNRQLLQPAYVGKLLLVNLPMHSVRRVVSGRKLLFAQWAPSGQTFAYATPAAVYVVGRSGARRKLASAPKPNWPAGGWMGWSPDGSYIGLGAFSDSLAVLDAATGKKRVLFDDPSHGLNAEARWWR